MMNKKQVTLLIVVVSVLLIGGVKFFIGLRAPAIDPQEARCKGNPQGRVKIVEFIDFQCPACAEGVKILNHYLRQHPHDMYIQMRYFPLANIHRHAVISALYSECAARQGKFWALNDLMMSQQKQWAQLISAEPAFQLMALQAGINMAGLNACLALDDVREALYKEKSLGQSLGLTSTPTYFINNKMIVGTKSLQEALKADFPLAAQEQKGLK